MGWKPGDIDGQRARVKQTGERIEAITTTGAVHDHVVSNDGINADYVRNGNQIIVDNSQPDPYSVRFRAPAPTPPRVVNPPC